MRSVFRRNNRPTDRTGNTNKRINFLTWHFKWYNNILWFLITLLRMPFAAFAQFANENLLLLLFSQNAAVSLRIYDFGIDCRQQFDHYGAWCIALSINWVRMFWRVFSLPNLFGKKRRRRRRRNIAHKQSIRHVCFFCLNGFPKMSINMIIKMFNIAIWMNGRKGTKLIEWIFIIYQLLKVHIGMRIAVVAFLPEKKRRKKCRFFWISHIFPLYVQKKQEKQKHSQEHGTKAA